MGGTLFVDITPASLSPVEEAELLYMIEEEKMAHDVYALLYDKFQVRTFQNIGNSEEQHTGVVRQALTLHGITDPTMNKGPGEFVNLDLKKLYDELVASGSENLIAALNVGARIEETDIADLDDALADTSVPYLVEMYERLQRASENHLRAFVRVLATLGENSYAPKVLTQGEFDDIINN